MRSLMLVAAAWLIGASPAAALEIKNVRNCFAPPFAGATRPDAKALKILGGDLIFITYEIEGLIINPKTKKASFTSTLELFDDKKQVFQKDTPSEVMPQLGGTRIPGEINVEIPTAQAPGKYKIRMTITDKEAKEKPVSFEYPFEVLPKGFGVVGVTAPAIGLIGTYHSTQFALVHMKLDKDNLCKVDLLMRVLDDKGKELSKMENSFPKDMPADTDLAKANFLPWHYPIYLNRTGQFTIEIVAKDLAADSVVTIRYPFVVIDATTVSSGK